LALEIDGRRALAGVLRQEGRAHPPLIEARIGPELTSEIARARHLDLDHVGAQLRELIAGERSRQHVGEIEDAEPGKKRAHRRAFCEIERYSTQHNDGEQALACRRTKSKRSSVR